MCMVDDAEYWKFSVTEHRRAAKVHACSECGRQILKGERHEYTVGMLDGYWSRYRVCVHCEAMRDWLDEMCGGWLFSFVFEELVDHWHEGYKSVEFARLIAQMRRGWHAGRDRIPTRAGALAVEMMRRQVA